METKAWAVDRPFIFPNWFRSRTGVSMSWSQSATKDSKTLASTGKREIRIKRYAFKLNEYGGNDEIWCEEIKGVTGCVVSRWGTLH